MLERLHWMDGEALYPYENLARFRIEASWPLQVERTADDKQDPNPTRGRDGSHRMFLP